MMMTRRRFAALAFSAALLLGPLAGVARADDSARAREFIQKLADTAMTTVAVKGLSDEERDKRFRTLFVDNFDLAEVGKLVLGRHWRAATAAEQAEFTKLFEEIQVLTWARRFKEYSGETLEILGTMAEADGDIQVDSRIRRAKLDPAGVTWRVHTRDGVPRILDIKVEGASMAQTHRSEYSSVIQSSGGKVEGLLAAMRKKIAQLQSEAATASAASASKAN